MLSEGGRKGAVRNAAYKGLNLHRGQDKNRGASTLQSCQKKETNLCGQRGQQLVGSSCDLEVATIHKPGRVWSRCGVHDMCSTELNMIKNRNLWSLVKDLWSTDSTPCQHSGA